MIIGRNWHGRISRTNSEIFFISNFMSKNEVFRHFLENAWKFLAEISYIDSSRHYLQLFYWYQAREISSSPIFRPKTAISYKKNQFFLIFSLNTVDTGFKLSTNVYLMILYNSCKDCMVIFAYWRQSNQEKCQKMMFFEYSREYVIIFVWNFIFK